MKKSTLFLAFLFTFITSGLVAQTVKKRCSTDEVMEQVFKTDPAARARYEAYQIDFNEQMKNIEIADPTNAQFRTEAIISIPVVVHILIPNPNLVTQQTIQRQIDTLNWYYGSQSATDSLRVYTPFRNRFGRTQIRFCLAQRDPNDFPTNGVTRKVSNRSYTGGSTDITNSAKGGENAWDTRRYLNMWVVQFSDGTLGYSYLPGTYPAGDGRIGYVVDYRAFGSGASYLFPAYNGGKTGVHEIGHYFNLYHPWSNASNTANNPSCTLDDGCSDTPLTSGPTFGCPPNPSFDACSPSGSGKMVQNHMDYSDDACMVLFTKIQVTRMETALNTSNDRKTLLTSNACIAPALPRLDIKPEFFNDPYPTVCDVNVKPVIQVRNVGTDTIKTFTVTYSLNGGALTSVNFTGTIPTNQFTSVPLNAATVNVGTNTIKLFTGQPNGQADENGSNDTLVYTFKVLVPVSNTFNEGFQGAFPPANWEVNESPVDNFTWTKTSQAGKNSTSSAYMNNFNYAANNRVDDLVSPPVKYSGADSVFLKFDLAAATYSYPGSTAVPLDTLEVLASTDCGKTYTSVYKKWGSELQTIGDPNSLTTDEFVPRNNGQWRSDSVNLTTLLGSGNTVRFAFRNTTNFENNIFVDNINFATKVLPERLKKTGFLISPNPFRERFSIQHYLPPTDLRGFGVYDAIGQQVLTRSFLKGAAQSYIEVDMSSLPSGMYTLKLLYTDRTASYRVIKVR